MYNLGDVLEFSNGELYDEEDLNSAYRYHGKVIKIIQYQDRYFYVITTADSSWLMPEANIIEGYRLIAEQAPTVGPVLSLYKDEDVDNN